MARKQQLPTPKLCERCDAFFPSIASATCPQCFAPLAALNEEEAALAAEVQIERLKDPAFLDRKAQEDEQFKEQSFGACFVVLCLTTTVAILSIALILVAAHQHSNKRVIARIPSSPSASKLLPMTIGNLHRDSYTILTEPGNGPSFAHGSYSGQIQIYALPNSETTSQALSSFRLAVSMVCSQTTPPMVSQEVHTNTAYYAIIGANGGLVGDASQKLTNEADR